MGATNNENLGMENAIPVATLQAIKEAKDLANEAIRKVNEYADMIHDQSTASIETSDGGITELAELVADLLKRVEALEAQRK